MKNLFVAIMALFVLTACEKIVLVYADDDEDDVFSVTFSVGGNFIEKNIEFEFGDATRAVAVGESNMTDLWVYDYVGGECKRGVRQMSSQSGFGTVTMDFAPGSHTLYFVASRGTGAEEDEEGKIVWSTPGDTFWAKVELDVSSGMDRNVSVTMKRVATCLTVAIEDVVPENMSRLAVVPDKWYCGLDYTTGEPCGAVESTERSVSVPASYVGKSGLSASFFGLSGASEWTTDFSVLAYDGSDGVLGSVSVSGAPFLRNRVTRYSGRLFQYGADFNVTLDDGWGERYEGTW